MLETIFFFFLFRDNTVFFFLLAKNGDVINPAVGLFHLITYMKNTFLYIIPFFFFSNFVSFLSPERAAAREKCKHASCSRKFDYTNVV